jgi:L-ribulose-5-phosphate 4-epimerase
VTASLRPAEIENDYELNTGHAIVRTLQAQDPLAMPAVLVAGHAPFCWGESPAAAAHIAWILEEVAQMAYSSLTINPDVATLSDALRDKHFLRKHGPAAYYGQKARGSSAK